MIFDDFWKLVENNGSVACFHRNECEDLWNSLTDEQRQAACAAIRRKLDEHLFVHYNPTIALRDNIPKKKKVQIITADEYYRRYHTQENMDNWVRVFIPEQQRTIYIKQP